MPSGHPGSGPYAGKGLQQVKVRCPGCGKLMNAHYLRYGNHRCQRITVPGRGVVGRRWVGTTR